MSDSGRSSDQRRWRFLLMVGVPLLFIDQLTKLLVRYFMLPGESVPLLWRLQLTYVQNTGSAFGLFVDQRVMLLVIGVVGVVLLLLLYRLFLPANRLALVSASLIVAGATGNLIDRLTLGFVTDFIDVVLWYDELGNAIHWPAFNVADSLITVGSLVLVCFFVLAVRRGERRGNGR